MEFAIRDNHYFVPILRFGWLEVDVLTPGRAASGVNAALRDRLNGDADALAEAAAIEGDPARLWSHLWALVDDQNEATPRLRALARSLSARVVEHYLEAKLRRLLRDPA